MITLIYRPIPIGVYYWATTEEPTYNTVLLKFVGVYRSLRIMICIFILLNEKCQTWASRNLALWLRKKSKEKENTRRTTQ